MNESRDLDTLPWGPASIWNPKSGEELPAFVSSSLTTICALMPSSQSRAHPALNPIQDRPPSLCVCRQRSTCCGAPGGGAPTGLGLQERSVCRPLLAQSRFSQWRHLPAPGRRGPLSLIYEHLLPGLRTHLLPPLASAAQGQTPLSSQSLGWGEGLSLVPFILFSALMFPQCRETWSLASPPTGQPH